METSPTAAKRVLVVEASELILTWVIPVIEKLGCRVTKAGELKAALSVIQQCEPLDLILLGDISRPTNIESEIPAAEMELLQQVRRNPKYRRTAVVVFTNLDWIDEAKRAGASNWIVKPCGADDLETVILPYLSSAAAENKKERHSSP